MGHVRGPPLPKFGSLGGVVFTSRAEKDPFEEMQEPRPSRGRPGSRSACALQTCAGALRASCRNIWQISSARSVSWRVTKTNRPRGLPTHAADCAPARMALGDPFFDVATSLLPPRPPRRRVPRMPGALRSGCPFRSAPASRAASPRRGRPSRRPPSRRQPWSRA